MKYCWEAGLFLHTLRRALAFIWVVFKTSLKNQKCSRECLVFKRFSYRRWGGFWSSAVTAHSPTQLLSWMGPRFLAGSVNVATWWGQLQQRPLLQTSRLPYNTPLSLSELYPLLEEVWLITWLGTLPKSGPQCATLGQTQDQCLGRNGCFWIQSSSHC